MLKIKFILSIFCIFVLLQADAQDLPSANVWGNTRVHLRTQNGDSSGYAPISNIVTWDNTTSKPSFNYALNQILYGNGTGQTSSSNITTDGSNLFLNGGVLRGLGTPSLSTDAVPLSYINSAINGSINYIPKFTSSGAIGNSRLLDDGTNINYYHNSSNENALILFPSDFATMNTGIYFRTAATANLRMVDGATFRIKHQSGERFTILPNGNVGIGTTSPARLLEVLGEARVGSLNISTSGANLFTLGSTTSGFFLYNNTTSTNNLFVTNSGNIGIGITSPFSKLQVVQNSSSGGYSTAVTSAQHGLYVGTSSVLSSDFLVNMVGGVSNISNGAGGTSYFSIRANGTAAFASAVQVGDATTATHAMNRQSSDARYLGISATATNSNLFRGLDTTVFAQRNQVNTFTQQNNFTGFTNIAGASAIAAAAHTNYTDGTDRIYTMQGDGNVRSSTYQALINANQANDTFAMTTAAQTFTLSSNLVNTVDVGLHASTFDSLDIRLPATMFDDNQTISITTSNKRMIIGQGDKIKITSSTGVTLLQIVNDTNSTLSEKYEINSAVLGYISMQIQYSKKRNLWRIVSFNNWVDQ